MTNYKHRRYLGLLVLATVLSLCAFSTSLKASQQSIDNPNAHKEGKHKKNFSGRGLVITTIKDNPNWPGHRPKGMLGRLNFPANAKPTTDQIIFDVVMHIKSGVATKLNKQFGGCHCYTRSWRFKKSHKSRPTMVNVGIS